LADIREKPYKWWQNKIAVFLQEIQNEDTGEHQLLWCGQDAVLPSQPENLRCTLGATKQDAYDPEVNKIL